MRRILHWIGRERLPGFLQNAISVAERTRKITLRIQPEAVGQPICNRLTVLSANLWHDWPRFHRLEDRLSAFVKLIETYQVDLLLVQEVVRTRSFKADRWLADRLKMAYVYSRANGSERIGFEEGLAIFSRFPIHPVPYLRQLSRNCIPFVRRLVLGAAIATPCGEVLAFSVHLGLLRSQNARQLHDLQHWIGRIAGSQTAIIGGDFNAADTTRRIRLASQHWIDAYRQVNRKGKTFTHEIRLPWGSSIRHRLDYVFIKQGQPSFEVVNVQHINAPGKHSDHHAVLAHLASGA